MFQVSTTSFHTTQSLFRKLNMALFNRTARLQTRQCWLKTELLPTAVNSLLKMNASELAWPEPSGLQCLGTILERYKSFQPKPENIDELKKVLQLIWDQLPQDSINKAILSFRKGFRLCASWWWTLRTHTKMNYLSDFDICNNTRCFLTMKITSFCWLFRAELNIWHRIFI